MKVTLAKGGDHERTVDSGSIQIPDLWHIANDYLERTGNEKLHGDILEVWHMAHDLKDAITGERGAHLTGVRGQL